MPTDQLDSPRSEHRAAVARLSILGLPVSGVTQAEALEVLLSYIASGTPHLILTADASGVVIAAEDPDFRDVWRRADLVTPDSTGILLAARRAGGRIPERVSGCDLAEHLCRLGAINGYSVFFYGAAPGVAEAAAAEMCRRYPGLEVAGTAHGFLRPEEQTELVTQIRAARPAVLLVALGIPRQEKWIHEHLAELGVPVCMGVGGTFDVMSGKVDRAPGWVQRMGCEWLYRLVRDPSKISKVKTLPRFLWMVVSGRSLS